ncbi:MAG: creatininase family protein [Burkholderiaceae bacterium]
MAVFLALVASTAFAAESVFLEDLTTAEVSALLKSGHTTILIPVGGTEQSGPHLLLGKHNERAHLLAGRIAQQLGNALVAPVLAYVPEGSINPPSGHMAFAGTISVPEAAFKSILDAAARGFKQHGFRNIVLLGDHGGYQRALGAVAKQLNHDWEHSDARAYFAAGYYGATQTSYVAALKAHGLTAAQIGEHAGSADTSLQMALDPASVKTDKFAQAAREGRSGGTNGDPRASSAALGQLGVDAVVRQTVADIRAAVSAPR